MSLQRFENRLVQTIKSSGDPTAAFTPIVDLGKIFVFNHFLVSNHYDQAITFRFESTDGIFHEFNIIAKTAWGLDGFLHNGIIDFKYSSAAPTEGVLNILSF